MSSHWFKGIYRSWSQHFGTQLATLTVLVATFVIVTTMLTVGLNMQRILYFWGESINITAYIEDSQNEDQVAKIRKSIADVGHFDEIKFISKDQAKSDFAKDLKGLLPDLVEDFSEESPFPASFVAGITSQRMQGLSTDKIEAIASRISEIAGIEDVSYGQDWVKNYASLVSGVGRLGFLLTVALLLGSIFVVGNSLRNSLSGRREEIEILELVGATPAMIRKPYLIEGLFMGFLAGCVALAISAVLFYLGVATLKSQIGFFAISQQVQFLGPMWISLCLLVFSLFGLVGSYLTVRQLNHGYAAARG